MSVSVTMKKETEVSLTTQEEGDMSVTTSDGTTSSVTLQHATSASPSTQEQRTEWTSVTTQHSPTSHQDVNAKHESLVMISGNSVSFHCTSSEEGPFRWTYWSLASQQSRLIYNGVRIYRAFPLANRMVDNSCGTRNCTLMFVDLQPYDTGSLACSRGSDNKYWSFTILG